MTKILLSGCMGRMGRAITQIVSDTPDAEIVCGFDIGKGDMPYPVYSNYSDIKEKADVIIDFSHPSNLNSLLEYAKQNNIPVVVSTTGLSVSTGADSSGTLSGTSSGNKVSSFIQNILKTLIVQKHSNRPLPVQRAFFLRCRR